MNDRINVFRRQMNESFTAFRRPLEERRLAQQRDAIEAFVTDRAIATVYHFTPVQNLASISAHGLLNRTQVQRLDDGRVIFPDEYRGDGAAWAVCCSIEWPNYKMMYWKEHNQNLEFAVLALDASILWELDCVFVSGNASRGDLRRQLYQLKANRFNRLNQLRTLFPDPDNRRLLWRSYPEDVQAEVLIVESPIPLRYFQFIYFKSFVAYRAAQLLPWPPHIKCESYPEIFRVRPDLRRW